MSLSGHSDIYKFQLINWTSNIIWYWVFLYYTNSVNFSKITSAEIMTSILGVFFTSNMLRLQQDRKSRDIEKKTILIKVLIFMLISVIEVYVNQSLLVSASSLASLVIPAHLPLIYGYEPKIFSILFLKVLLSPVVVWGFVSSYSVIVALYFMPNIIYGLFSYFHYFHLLNSLSASNLTREAKLVTNDVLRQFLVIAANMCAQSSVVSYLVKTNSDLAFFERLLRSSYSFVFPHIYRVLRSKPLISLSIGGAAVFLISINVIVFCVVLTKSTFMLIAPTYWDIMNSFIAGRFFIVDIILICTSAIEYILIHRS